MNRQPAEVKSENVNSQYSQPEDRNGHADIGKKCYDIVQPAAAPDSTDYAGQNAQDYRTDKGPDRNIKGYRNTFGQEIR